VWSLDNYDQIVAFRQKVTPKCVRFSTYYKNILIVGNDDGSVNFLSIKNVKAVQTMHACTSAIFEIMELDEITIIAIGANGEMTLLYNEAE